MATELFPTLRPFLAWWGGELAATLPARVRAVAAPSRARLEATVREDGLDLRLVREGRTIATGRLSRDGARSKPDRQTRRLIGDAAETVLRLPQSATLYPRLQLPIGAAADISAAAAAEMDRRTPFSADQVRFDWRVTGSDLEVGQVYVDALVARREDVDRAAALATSLGLRVDRIDGPRDAAGPGAGFNLLPPDRRPRRRGASRFVGPLAALALCLGAAALALKHAADKAELAALEARLAELRAANAEVAAMEDQLARLREARAFLTDRKLAAPGVLPLLAEITERLPDGDWLYGFTYDDGAVRLEGFSADASRLPDLLESSPMLAGVGFGAPVTRDAEAGLDQFALDARVSGDGAAQ